MFKVILDIDNHIGFNECAILNKVCHILFQKKPIRYFYYQRIYSNNFYTFLTTWSEPPSYFFHGGAYPNAWQFSVPFNSLATGYVFWDIARKFNTSTQHELSTVLSKNMKLPYGIDIFQKHEEYCDIYTFSSSDVDIYRVSLLFLKQFIFYFKQECSDLLKQAKKEKFFTPIILQPDAQLPIVNTTRVRNEVNESPFQINRFYMCVNNSEIYFTAREIACLNKLSDGYSSKEVARLLDISHRTIEYHMANVKSKLRCNKLTEVLKILKNTDIFEI